MAKSKSETAAGVQKRIQQRDKSTMTKIVGLADDFEAGLVLEHVANAESDYGVIVGDDDTDVSHVAGGCGRFFRCLLIHYG